MEFGRDNGDLHRGRHVLLVECLCKKDEAVETGGLVQVECLRPGFSGVLDRMGPQVKHAIGRPRICTQRLDDAFVVRALVWADRRRLRISGGEVFSGGDDPDIVPFTLERLSHLLARIAVVGKHEPALWLTAARRRQCDPFPPHRRVEPLRDVAGLRGERTVASSSTGPIQ